MGKRNVTVAVDHESYLRARIWAAEQQTTISAVVSLIIAHLPESPVARYAAESLAQRATSERYSSEHSKRIASLIRTVEHLSDPAFRTE
jgi:hypothetical protein